MPVPLPPPHPRTRRALTALAFTLACLLPASPPNHPLRSSLSRLRNSAIKASLPHYLLSGESILTLHFVDDSHLLATFTARGLLTRLPDAQETDNDQNVTALLLELPSGKILARTSWRERDRGQYLWPIGHGRFILRIRNKLTLLNPLANLAAGKAFEEEPFIELHRTIGYISLSPNADLISIETTAPAKPKSAAAVLVPVQAPTSPASSPAPARRLRRRSRSTSSAPSMTPNPASPRSSHPAVLRCRPLAESH